MEMNESEREEGKKERKKAQQNEINSKHSRVYVVPRCKFMFFSAFNSAYHPPLNFMHFMLRAHTGTYFWARAFLHNILMSMVLETVGNFVCGRSWLKSSLKWTLSYRADGKIIPIAIRGVHRKTIVCQIEIQYNAASRHRKTSSSKINREV